jgi:hypothetical protein
MFAYPVEQPASCRNWSPVRGFLMSAASMKLEYTAGSGVDVAAVVMGYFDKGGDVFFSRTHSGVAKIKVRYGPFKLRTARFCVSDKIAVSIKDMMRARMNKA